MRLTRDGRGVSGMVVTLWLLALLVLVIAFVFLSIEVSDNPAPEREERILREIEGWDTPGLDPVSGTVSFLTDNWPAAIAGIVIVSFLWLIGMNSTALSLALVGGIAGTVAFTSDYTLGVIVERSRPFTDSGPSYPSGHTFGTTVVFGFLGYLAVYYRLRPKYLIPVLTAVVSLILAVGFSRILEMAHWPTDVVAAYLLAGIGMLVLIPFFLWVQTMSWMSRPKRHLDHSIEACEACRIEMSIASTVVLDPDEGTATKTYKAPLIVRMLYWFAFQAKFPYESNEVSLRAAEFRRQIASLLTRHRFGKDLVAHVTSVNCAHGSCSFVTEFVPGDKVENDAGAKEFLGQVSKIFAEAGLSVWQVNPRNPHAHTNVIRTPEGDLKIIDLESAVVTPFPAPGQWRSSFRRGAVPIFDDIDFDRMRTFVDTNAQALSESLGHTGLADLRHAIFHGEAAIKEWRAMEPRLWGRFFSRLYSLLDWKTAIQHMTMAIRGSDKAAQSFLMAGIRRWQLEGRLDSVQAEELRACVAAEDARDALHHMGAHVVISAIAVPIPGFRSVVRAGWTAAFWVRAQARRIRRRGDARPNVHTPLVMLIALLPIFGALAYLAARPLRNRLLVRLMLDQVAYKMPFGSYRKLRLSRWLVPQPTAGPAT